MTHEASEGKKRKHTFVTTDTGRILRVETGAAPVAPQPASAAAPVDPARREDVLFRVRREQGHEASPWWGVGAFLVISTLVVLLLGWVPGDA